MSFVPIVEELAQLADPSLSISADCCEEHKASTPAFVGGEDSATVATSGEEKADTPDLGHPIGDNHQSVICSLCNAKVIETHMTNAGNVYCVSCYYSLIIKHAKDIDRNLELFEKVPEQHMCFVCNRSITCNTMEHSASGTCHMECSKTISEYHAEREDQKQAGTFRSATELPKKMRGRIPRTRAEIAVAVAASPIILPAALLAWGGSAVGGAALMPIGILGGLTSYTKKHNDTATVVVCCVSAVPFAIMGVPIGAGFGFAMAPVLAYHWLFKSPVDV